MLRNNSHHIGKDLPFLAKARSLMFIRSLFMWYMWRVEDVDISFLQN